MNRTTYTFACRVVAIFVALDGLATCIYSIAQLIGGGDDDGSAWLDLFGYPWLLFVFFPGLLWFVVAWWLWKVPPSLIPSSVDLTLGADVSWLKLGMKLLGVYFLIISIPNLAGNIFAIATWDILVKVNYSSLLTGRSISSAIQACLAYLLLFHTDWLFRIFTRNDTSA